MDDYWLLTSQGMKEIKEKEKNVDFVFPCSIFPLFFAEQMTEGQIEGDELENKSLCLFVLSYFLSAQRNQQKDPNRQMYSVKNNKASYWSPKLSQKTSVLEMISYTTSFSFPTIFHFSGLFLCRPTLNLPQTLKKKKIRFFPISTHSSLLFLSHLIPFSLT